MTTTTRATRAKVFGILRAHNCPEELAETILGDITTAGIHLVEVEPPPVYTGERAEEPNQHVDRLRAIVRAATKPTEYEETES